MHTKTYQQLTYTDAQAACRNNTGFFLPSETLWNNLLMEMKTGTDLECRKIAATFDNINLWYARHGKEVSGSMLSSVCVGK